MERTSAEDDAIEKECEVDPGDIKAEEVDPMDYLKKLIKLCIYIFKLKERDDRTSHCNRRPPILQMLINYDNAITKQNLVYDDVIEDIFKAYVANKKDILNDDYTWLLSPKIDVKFSYVKPGTKPKSYMSTCCICVGSIFRMAGDMFNKHSHDKIDPTKGNEYSYLPTRIVRYLYLLFIETIENSDHKDKLGRLVDKKEKALGITDGKYEEDFGEGMFGGGFKGGIETIVKLLFGSLKKHGIKLPEGVSLDSFNFSDLSGMAAKLFNTEDPFIADLLKEIGTCKGGVELTKLLMGKARDPEFIAKVSKMLNITVAPEKIQEAISKNEEVLGTIIDKNFPSIKKKMDEVTASSENSGISVTEAMVKALEQGAGEELNTKVVMDGVKTSVSALVAENGGNMDSIGGVLEAVEKAIENKDSIMDDLNSLAVCTPEGCTVVHESPVFVDSTPLKSSPVSEEGGAILPPVIDE